MKRPRSDSCEVLIDNPRLLRRNLRRKLNDKKVTFNDSLNTVQTYYIEDTSNFTSTQLRNESARYQKLYGPKNPIQEKQYKHSLFLGEFVADVNRRSWGCYDKSSFHVEISNIWTHIHQCHYFQAMMLTNQQHWGKSCRKCTIVMSLLSYHGKRCNRSDCPVPLCGTYSYSIE